MQPARLGSRVIVQEGDDATFSDGDATVPRSGQAAPMAVLDHRDTGEGRPRASEELGRMVDHEDRLACRKVLVPQRRQRSHDVFPPFERVCTDDDGDVLVSGRGR